MMKTDFFALWRHDPQDDSKLGVTSVAGVTTYPEPSNNGGLRDTKNATPKKNPRSDRCGNSHSVTPATPSKKRRCSKTYDVNPSNDAGFGQVSHLPHVPHLKSNNFEQPLREVTDLSSGESAQIVMENIKNGKPMLMEMPGYGRVYWVKDQYTKKILRDKLIAEENPIPIYALGELQQVPIKRVQCHHCTFFVRDKIGSGGGLGKCEINAIHHPKKVMFPGVLRRCDYHKLYEPKNKEKMVPTSPDTTNHSNCGPHGDPK